MRSQTLLFNVIFILNLLYFDKVKIWRIHRFKIIKRRGRRVDRICGEKIALIESNMYCMMILFVLKRNGWIYLYIDIEDGMMMAWHD